MTNPENFDDGMTRIAPKGEFKAQETKEVIEGDAKAIQYGYNIGKQLSTKRVMGCGKDIQLFYGSAFYKVPCGETNPISEEIIYCKDCKRSTNKGITILDVKEVDDKLIDNLLSSKETKPIILDNNPISLAKYAEEYPENWKVMTQNVKLTPDELLTQMIDKILSEEDREKITIGINKALSSTDNEAVEGNAKVEKEEQDK